jgi:3-hydroxyisobutyrate dehydrogenase-like beta-hydroxyacid dehydrogenase
MNTTKKAGDYGPIGMIGLGNMGLPMSDNMIKDGFTVIGTARTQKSRDALTAVGGTAVDTAAEVAKRCKLIILALPSVPVFNDICTQLAEYCEKGSIIVETSTFPLVDKLREKERLEAYGLTMLDVPLSGTGEQAKHKDVVAFGSGDEAAYAEAVAPIMGFCKAQYYLGEFGNGMKMKYIANQLVAIHNLSAAEAVLFASKMGMDPNEMIKVIEGGAGGSRMLSVRGPVMANRTWTQPQITNTVFHKDVTLIDEALHLYGCPSPLFQTTKAIYTAAIAGGHGEHDTSSIYEVLERMSKPPETPEA